MSHIRALEAKAQSTKPLLVFMDVTADLEDYHKHNRLSREPSLSSRTSYFPDEDEETAAADFYGLRLLTHVSSETSDGLLSKLVVPVAIVEHTHPPTALRSSSHSGLLPPGSQYHTLSSPTDYNNDPNHASNDSEAVEPHRVFRCLKSGAVDVIRGPLSKSRLNSTMVHATKAHIEAEKHNRASMDLRRMRKQSWVGMQEEKPYAYLREEM